MVGTTVVTGVPSAWSCRSQRWADSLKRRTYVLERSRSRRVQSRLRGCATSGPDSLHGNGCGQPLLLRREARDARAGTSVAHVQTGHSDLRGGVCGGRLALPSRCPLHGRGGSGSRPRSGERSDRSLDAETGHAMQPPNATTGGFPDECRAERGSFQAFPAVNLCSNDVRASRHPHGPSVTG